MGAKLYSASRCTRIKEIIHKLCNNLLISEHIYFPHVVLCQNKGQVMDNKVCV